MTKEITKAYILQQMQDKLQLRELIPEKFCFSEMVTPVYDIEQHLKEWCINHKTVSITSGPIAFDFFVVPQDERWTIRGYNIVFLAAGAHTVTGLLVMRDYAAGDFIYLDMTLGQTVSYAINLPIVFVANPGDKIQIYIDSYTSTASLRLYLDCSVETIR